jgi:hypothetical protein
MALSAGAFREELRALYTSTTASGTSGGFLSITEASSTGQSTTTLGTSGLDMRAITSPLLKAAGYQSSGVESGEVKSLLGATATPNAGAGFPVATALAWLQKDIDPAPLVLEVHVPVAIIEHFIQRDVSLVASFEDMPAVAAHPAPLPAANGPSSFLQQAIANPADLNGASSGTGASTVAVHGPGSRSSALAAAPAARGPIVENEARVPLAPGLTGAEVSASPEARGITPTEPVAITPFPARRLTPVPAIVRALSQSESSAPQESDLLTQFLPFDRASLELAIDRFLDEFEGLGAELSRLDGSMNLLPGLIAIAVGVSAAGLAVRIRRNADSELAASGSAGAIGDEDFPGLPRSWSWSEL